MSNNICLVCGNTHDPNLNCLETRKDQSIPNDRRNVQCVVCSDWFHKDGIYNHLRSCAKKKISELENTLKFGFDELNTLRQMHKIQGEELTALKGTKE